jgi:cyclopropane-fatty-acyl-phospholipid synthase
MTAVGIELAERGLVPDGLVRLGIRRLLRERIAVLASRDAGDRAGVVESLGRGPMAVATDAANAQHYEWPPEMFEAVLGRHLKYSCGYWPDGVATLDDAEAAALGLTCARADLADGMDVLDLGCGWGSLSLWIAERYPRSRISAVSNSRSQGRFIRAAAASRGLTNLTVQTADMPDFTPVASFDRIVSVEMFEHMRNYALLLDRVAGWLRPDGRLFAHVFCHRTEPYLFEDLGPGDWMARHFFTGGVMPSETLLDRFAESVRLERRWRVDGRHYARTARAWLHNLDDRREQVRAICAATCGTDADRWVRRWRLFFMACEELFAYDEGREWFVSHSLWRPA